jgi:hypothetical protein
VITDLEESAGTSQSTRHPGAANPVRHPLATDAWNAASPDSRIADLLEQFSTEW